MEISSKMRLSMYFDMNLHEICDDDGDKFDSVFVNFKWILYNFPQNFSHENHENIYEKYIINFYGKPFDFWNWKYWFSKLRHLNEVIPGKIEIVRYNQSFFIHLYWLSLLGPVDAHTHR